MLQATLTVRRGTALLVALLMALGVFASSPAHAATTADRTRPKVATTTKDGAVLVAPSSVTDMRVTGTASDDRAIRHVEILYMTEFDAVFFGYGMFVWTTADLACRNARRICTWSVDIPEEAGDYTVVATAVDRAGNRRRSAPVNLTVVGRPMVPFAR